MRISINEILNNVQCTYIVGGDVVLQIEHDADEAQHKQDHERDDEERVQHALGLHRGVEVLLDLAVRQRRPVTGGVPERGSSKETGL